MGSSMITLTENGEYECLRCKASFDTDMPYMCCEDEIICPSCGYEMDVEHECSYDGEEACLEWLVEKT